MKFLLRIDLNDFYLSHKFQSVCFCYRGDTAHGRLKKGIPSHLATPCWFLLWYLCYYSFVRARFFPKKIRLCMLYRQGVLFICYNSQKFKYFFIISWLSLMKFWSSTQVLSLQVLLCVSICFSNYEIHNFFSDKMPIAIDRIDCIILWCWRYFFDKTIILLEFNIRFWFYFVSDL
jgi:hypothetical protein